ncbi:MAG: DUF805 domain-containing protein [Xanthobacteraceae bacterium]
MNAFAWFFLSLRGRISRQEFWLGYCGIVVVALLLVHALPHPSGVIFDVPGDDPGDEPWRSAPFSFGWPEFISLMLAWPVVAIYAKRLHDLNLSAWWLLVLPAITAVAALGAFDELLVLAYCIILFVLGILSGSKGLNRFGEDPLARTLGGKSDGNR